MSLLYNYYISIKTSNTPISPVKRFIPCICSTSSRKAACLGSFKRFSSCVQKTPILEPKVLILLHFPKKQNLLLHPVVFSLLPVVKMKKQCFFKITNRKKALFFALLLVLH